MIDSPDMGLIGVDGGGTSCRIALERHGGRTEIVLGSANVTTDFRGATKLIREGLDAVAAKAGLSGEVLWTYPAYLGLAGIVDEEGAGAVARALPLKNVLIEDDRRATVIGALGDADGTVAGIGTGSFLARRSGVAMRMVGGWGLRLGDEASGAWLGRGLLTSVLEVVDGLSDATPLTEKILKAFRGSPGRIVTFGLSADPAEFAAFAPGIIEAARSGDPVGVDLMRAGAAYLTATMIKLGWQDGEPLCLIGGVGAHYLDYLPDRFARSVVPSKGTALDGALKLAAGLAVREKRQQVT